MIMEKDNRLWLPIKFAFDSLESQLLKLVEVALQEAS